MQHMAVFLRLVIIIYYKAIGLKLLDKLLSKPKENAFSAIKYFSIFTIFQTWSNYSHMLINKSQVMFLVTSLCLTRVILIPRF